MPSIICGMPQSTDGLKDCEIPWDLLQINGLLRRITELDSSAREQFNGGTQHDKLRENYWL